MKIFGLDEDPVACHLMPYALAHPGVLDEYLCHKHVIAEDDQGLVRKHERASTMRADNMRSNVTF
jgi:hypothetical protein